MARLNDERKKITEAQQILLDQINAQVEAFTKMEDAHVQFTTELITQTGEAAIDIVKEVEDVFNKIRALPSPFPRWARGESGDSGDNVYNPGTAGKTGTASPLHDAGDSGTSGGRAAGFYGQITTPTSITVGEAGTETVAVLRNPRQMLMGGAASGGGGIFAPISISITGNKISDEADEERLATLVARRVQEELSRRTSTTGFFSAR
jgi:hypothetical protein